MQTLTEPSFYRNNSGLCGFPLADCPTTSPASDEKTGEGEDQWLYYCVTAGVVFGFWLWFGLLFSVETWRCALLFSVDGMQSKIMQKVSHIDQFISKSSNDQYTM